MPLFVVDYTYSAETAAGRDTYRSAHRAWLSELVDRQTVIACGPYADDGGAFILIESDTTDTVAAFHARSLRHPRTRTRTSNSRMDAGDGSAPHPPHIAWQRCK
nr:hypothetical protein JVH1_3591 [Rhodococcus sp. JVH1]